MNIGAPSDPLAKVCENPVAGPATSPPGAVVVDPAIDEDTYIKTKDNPPGTTFWLAPGVHTLTNSEYGQVSPKDGNTYLGAPGAINSTGAGKEHVRIRVQKSKNVTIRRSHRSRLRAAGRTREWSTTTWPMDWVIENNITRGEQGGRR